MSQLNDAKSVALKNLGFVGALNDMELQWLQNLGATANEFNDAWKQIIDVAFPVTEPDINLGKLELFRGLGATGNTLTDIEFDYWVNIA